MKEKSTFLHVGLTVSDIDRILLSFIRSILVLNLEMKSVFPPEFIGGQFPNFTIRKREHILNCAFLKSPNGIVLGVIPIQLHGTAERPVWNKTAYHHICLKVDSVNETL